MRFSMVHANRNVFDLDKSLRFYEQALGLREVQRIAPVGGEFIIVYLKSDGGDFRLELTWLANRTERYHLGDNEIHLAFATKDYQSAYEHHKRMGCICYENPEMGIYFIADPDGYWLEIVEAGGAF